MVDTQPNPDLKPQGDPGADGAGAGQRDAGGQDTKPTLEELLRKNEALTTDIGKERDRRKTAETALTAKNTADQLAAAKSAEEIESIRTAAAADITKMQRDADIRVAAASQGIHEDFIQGADDGKAPVADVLKAAKARQDAMLKQHAGTSGTINLQSGGHSPDGGGQRIWKASEVAAMKPVDFRKNEDEILKAQREGRYRPGE